MIDSVEKCLYGRVLCIGFDKGNVALLKALTNGYWSTS